MDAKVVKAIIEPHNGNLYVLGVAEYFNDCVNFRVRFDPEDVYYADEFFNALREELAKEFDLPTYKVDVSASMILEKMIYWAYKFESLGIH